MQNKLLSTSQVAAELGITRQRVSQLISEGRLPAEKMGRDLFIKASDLKSVANRKWGRPLKKKAEKGKK